MKASILCASMLAGCVGSSEPTGEATAPQEATCQIDMVWTNPPHANYSYGRYEGLPCPMVSGGQNDLSAYCSPGCESWTCWQYGQAWCCAASASSKAICNSLQ